MSEKAPLATKDLNQDRSKIPRFEFPSTKLSNLRPKSAMPSYKRKLPNLPENTKEPAPKVFRTNTSRAPTTKATLKPIPHPINKTNSRNNSVTSINNKPQKPAGTVSKWEPRNVLQLRKKALGTANKLGAVQERLKILEEEREIEVQEFLEEQGELKTRLGGVERERDGLQGALKESQKEVTTLRTSFDVCTSLKAQLDLQLTTAKALTKLQAEQMESQQSRIAQLQGRVASLETELDEAHTKSLEEEATRKKLHNTIQELKGNIRVYGRVRPLLSDEKVGRGSDLPFHMTFPDPNNKLLEVVKLPTPSFEVSVRSSARKPGADKHEFQFDRVFPPSASQELVFNEISQLVQSALDGYNVCIFAYGQTGSGKTYTMEGNGIGRERGVIQRSVEQVFESVEQLGSKGWTYKVEVSFLEIYNESIRDLLVMGKGGCKGGEGGKHDIRLVGPNTTEVYVTDLTTHVVTHCEEVKVLLKRASQSRSVAETKCNERSSRSHSVFRMRLSGSNADTHETCCGMLNLVDLAGSERLKESGSQGQRLKETQNINKSLANLSNVIMALANKDVHIPYRNSKLTHLLQNCLGGSAKILMFVNVSPREECLQESLNSLRFATKVNQCNIGVAQKKCK